MLRCLVGPTRLTRERSRSFTQLFLIHISSPNLYYMCDYVTLMIHALFLAHGLPLRCPAMTNDPILPFLRPAYVNPGLPADQGHRFNARQ